MTLSASPFRLPAAALKEFRTFLETVGTYDPPQCRVRVGTRPVSAISSPSAQYRKGFATPKFVTADVDQRMPQITRTTSSPSPSVHGSAFTSRTMSAARALQPSLLKPTTHATTVNTARPMKNAPGEKTRARTRTEAHKAESA